MKRPDLLIALVLALLPALFFWRLIAPNPADRMNVPAGDFTGQYYPLRVYAAHELTAGRLPLWNPSPYGGQPALADIQSGALYPPQMIEALLLHWLGFGLPVWALELQAIAHFSWAALGAFLLGRRMARRAKAPPRHARFAGVLVSLVFTYSGYLTGFPVQQLTILEVSAWAPWVLWAVDRLGGWRLGIGDWRLRARDAEPGLGAGITGAILVGLTLGLSLLPGHPQTALYVVYLALAFYVFRVFSDVLRPSSPGYLLLATCYLLLALALALALSAAQLLPTLEFIARSPRADMSYEAVSFGLPLRELMSVVYPGYLGGSPEYVGILPLVLVGLALALGRSRRDVAFWTLAGLLALLLALGGNTFVYPIFYLLAPGFDAVRHQERAFLVYALSAAALSGYGGLVLAHAGGPLARGGRLRLRRFERGLRLAFWAALAVTALFVYGWAAGEHSDLFAGVLRHHVFGLLILFGSVILLALRRTRLLRRPLGMALIAGWIAFNLFSVNWRFNLEQPGAAGPFPPTPLTEYLRAATGVGVTTPPARIASAGLLPGGPGAATVYGLHDVTGNTPLQLAALQSFEARVPEWRRWQLLNVHYVLSDRDLAGPGLARVFPAAQPAQGEVRAYAMGDPFPRAWVVHAVEVIPDDQVALARLSTDAFDVRRAALVAEPLDLALGAASAQPSSARIIAYGPHEITLEVDAAGDGLLVLSEVYYPGWRASLDGQPAPLVRADYLLRGVPVPAGRHTVRVWYAPPSVRAGLVISGLTWAMMGGLGVWYIARRLRRPFPSSPRDAHLPHRRCGEPIERWG